jgi:hypothetical protein
MLRDPIWILAEVIVAIAVTIFIRHAFGRLCSEQTLTMTVWASLGPFSSADDAEDTLRRSVRAVFGAENYAKHAGWVQGHGENFRLWEGRGNFNQSLDFMRQVYLPFARGARFEQARQKIIVEAQKLAFEAMGRINQDMEPTGHLFELETKPDGSLDFSIREIFPGATENLAACIANNAGHNLWTAWSDTGMKMRKFLMDLSRSSLGRDPEDAEDIGRLWLGCYDRLWEKPESETTAAFRALNDAWWKEAPPWADAPSSCPKDNT